MTSNVAPTPSQAETQAPKHAFEYRTRPCSICGTPAHKTWMPAKVDFSELNEFAFASRKLPEYMHFELSLCTHCDLVFANHVPTDKWFEQCYTHADFDASNESNFAAHTYAKELAKRLQRLPTHEHALDIGAGDGAFVSELVKLGFHTVTGVEPSLEPVNRAPATVKHLLINDFFRAENFAQESYDLITCFQTLEHVERPGVLFADAHRLLKPGGAFLTVAHNFRAPLARLMGEKSPIYDVEHLQLFSPKSLRKVYVEHGYEQIEVCSIANAYPLQYWLKLFPMPRALKEAMLRRMQGGRLGNLLVSARVGNILGFGIKKRNQ